MNKGVLVFDLVILGLLLAIISVFLPFFSITPSYYSNYSSGVSLMEEGMYTDGIIVLTICVLGGAVILLERDSSGVRQLVVGAMIIAAALLELYGNQAKVKELENYSITRIRGDFGFYGLILGGLLLIIAGVIVLLKNRHAAQRKS